MDERRDGGIPGECPGGLPDELEAMPAGVGLAEALASVDRSTLDADGLLRLAAARSRLLAQVQAQLLADLHAVAHAAPSAEAGPQRRSSWAETETAFALTWTSSRATGEIGFAEALIDRLPMVFAALAAGVIDRPKAYVFAQVLAAAEVSVARAVASQVIEAAPELTTAEIGARLRRLPLAADPQASAKRAREDSRSRRVGVYLNDNNLAGLAGYELAPHRVAAAWERLSAIARAAKAAGDQRRVDQLRADALLDLLVGDGVAAGGPITDGGLGGGGLHADDEGALTGGEGEGVRAGDGAGEAVAPGRGTPWPTAPADPTLLDPASDPTITVPSDALPSAAIPPDAVLEPPALAVGGDEPEQIEHEVLRPLWAAGFAGLPSTRPGAAAGPAAGLAAAGRAAAGPMPGPRKGVVEIQVPFATLTGQAELPGEIAGFGPVLADIARQVASQQAKDTWRFSVYDGAERLLYHGITRHRPRPVATRRPDAETLALVRARDRTCVAPGCRHPAWSADIDHIHEWARGGDHHPANLAVLCRRHHMFKHATGTELVQPAPGAFIWTTPAGRRYTTRPSPSFAVPELAVPELASPG